VVAAEATARRTGGRGRGGTETSYSVAITLRQFLKRRRKNTSTWSVKESEEQKKVRSVRRAYENESPGTAAKNRVRSMHFTFSPLFLFRSPLLFFTICPIARAERGTVVVVVRGRRRPVVGQRSHAEPPPAQGRRERNARVVSAASDAPHNSHSEGPTDDRPFAFPLPPFPRPLYSSRDMKWYP
jgi:hypothetical protein